MTWTRLDDRWDDSEKLAAASEAVGDSAYALWARAVTFCNRSLTDGRISGPKLRALTLHKRPQDVVDALVKAGAIDPIADGSFEVHDFLHWNDSKKAVEDRRMVKRQAASRGGAATSAARQASSRRVAPCLTTAAPLALRWSSPSPSPSPSPSEEAEAAADPAAAAAANPEQAPGPDHRDHGPPRRSTTQTPDGQAILAALKASDSLMGVASLEFAQRLAAHCDPIGGRLAVADVLGAIAEADAKESTRLSVGEPHRDRGTLASMVAGFVKQATRAGKAASRGLDAHHQAVDPDETERQRLGKAPPRAPEVRAAPKAWDDLGDVARGLWGSRADYEARCLS